MSKNSISFYDISDMDDTEIQELRAAAFQTLENMQQNCLMSVPVSNPQRSQATPLQNQFHSIPKPQKTKVWLR